MSEGQTLPEANWIAAEDVLARMNAGEALRLVDVREPFEFALGHFKDARLIPLVELEKCSGELEKDEELILYSRRGERSADGAALLLRLGFERVRSMRGGIEAWRKACGGDCG